MQSGYGSVSEMQQFMMESCGSSIFSISAASPNPSADIHAAAPQPLKYHPLHPHHHHQPPHPQPPPPPPHHFSPFHPIPITQQLFQQSHQFQLLQHQHENSAGATAAAGGGPSFLAPAMNFKLAANESSGGGSHEGLNDDDGGSESRLHHHWQREEKSAIKEPSWRPLDIDYINRNNKRCKEKETETPTNKYSKKTKEGAEPDHGEHITGGSNYKLFSELEAICKPGVCSLGGGGGGGANQTGSGSALTGDETALMPTATNPPGILTADHHVGGSETSAGEEATARKFSKGSGRKKRKRRQQKKQQLSSVMAFFENLVKQLMEHQENLHQKFLEVMERRDQERTLREEAWRRQEAAKSSHEAAARAHDRVLASSREAAIISFLEKTTGETLRLPEKLRFPSQLSEEPGKLEAETTQNPPTEPSNNANKVPFNTSRWPRAEVEALIQVRSRLESRFQEPGLKGPLWEEVSATMAAMGYHRSAKRCKEKWENINKYFRKTKDSSKKRPRNSKTCPYFHQLDQLYSKSLNKSHPASSSSPNANVAAGGAIASGTAGDRRKDNSELLDAIVVSTDQQGFKFPEMSSLHDFGFNGKGDDNSELHRNVGSNGEEDDEEDEEEGGGGEEGEEREEGEG